MVKKRKDALTLRDIRLCIAKGFTIFSIDRELLEDLSLFLRASIGEYLCLRGFVVNRGRETFLRPGLFTDSLIKLEGLNNRVASSVWGEPVVVEGFKVDKKVLRVERISISSIVKRKPYASFAYLKEVLLDGVELSTPEDLVALCLISSPRLSNVGAGGARQAILGSYRSYLDRRLRRSTMSVSRIWKFGTVTCDRVRIVERAFSRYAEVSADIDGEVDRIIEIETVDFPTYVVRAPRESVVDVDAIDFTLWVKGIRPKLTPRKKEELLSYATSKLCSWLSRVGMDPRMRILSIDYSARPSTALRLAMAMCRARGCGDPEEFVDSAIILLEKAFDVILSELSRRPMGVVKLGNLEKSVLKVLERYEPEGATSLTVARELGVEDERSIVLVLERLRSRGLVYCPRPGVYRVVPHNV